LTAKLNAGIVFLVRHEIWIVTALVAAGMASTRLLLVVVAVELLYWLLRRLACGRFSLRTPLDWGVGLLALMLPVTLWATPRFDATLQDVLLLCSGVLLFYSVVNWAGDARRLRWLVLGAVLLGLALALLATVSVDWFVNKLNYIPAVFYAHFTNVLGESVHPNVMAGYLVILLPVAAALLLFAWRGLGRRLRLGLAFAGLFILAILILTKSRGAWMGFGAAVLLLAALRWRRGWLLLPACLLAGAAMLALVGVRPALEALATSGTVGGVDMRVEIWSRAIYMVQDFSITGIGMGTFGDLADALYPFFLAAPGSVPSAHNLYLQVAVDLGIPGLIAWLAVFDLVSCCAWWMYRRGRLLHDPWVMALGAGFLASQLALAVHGLTDTVTWGMVRPAPLVWGLWGLVVASWNLYAHPLSPPSSPEFGRGRGPGGQGGPRID
jgi:putative inorganic carbon (HCO3(-)) transporter